MDKYTKNIMDLIKANYEAVAGTHTYQTADGAREFYLENLDDNLYTPMSVGARESYKNGSGNELSDKMKSLRSSSAMTYNLFWDMVAEIKDGSKGLGKGVYQVELEKQFHTLKTTVSRTPANLDAFLYCKHTYEAIACEMKMTEWIFNNPGTLKHAYLEPSNYENAEVGKVFADVAKTLIGYDDGEDENTVKDTYPCKFKRYDAFQMLKHTIACYNACEFEEPRKIQKLTLVNCAWTISNPKDMDLKVYEKYTEAEKCEREEFESFKDVMKPIKGLFKKIGIDFEIRFFTFNEFLDIFNKTQDESDYLRRYTMRELV